MAINVNDYRRLSLKEVKSKPDEWHEIDAEQLEALENAGGVLMVLKKHDPDEDCFWDRVAMIAIPTRFPVAIAKWASRAEDLIEDCAGVFDDEIFEANLRVHLPLEFH